MQRLVEHGPTPEAVEEVQQAIKLRKHGRPTKEEEGKGSETTFLENPGRGAAYIRARLQRDHPELAEALERGEFRSARARAGGEHLLAEVVEPAQIRDQS